MADFIPCDVESRFLSDGTPRPYKVNWKNTNHPVLETGRTWREDSSHHILVKLTGQITLELKYDGTWSGRIVGKPRFSST
jgi:hypothetical protein